MAVMFVDAGALRSELALEISEPEPDGLGGYSESWVEVATLFGRIEPVNAETVFGADQTLESETHRVTLRWRGDVKSGMRLSKLCKAKFANPSNFRGFPHLPGNDDAYGYVTDDGEFDGGALVP